MDIQLKAICLGLGCQVEFGCPATHSQANYSQYEWIDSVSINDQEFVSGANGGYKGHLDTPATMNYGKNTFTLNPGFSDYQYVEYWGGWMDLNGDQIFSEDEKLFDYSGSTTTTMDIQLPETVAQGSYRLRVVMMWDSAPSPCGAYSYGETEDFTVSVGQDLQLETPYNLTLDYDFTVRRDGSIGDSVTWVVEKDGTVVLRRNAASELEYRYYSNTFGSDINIWLEEYIDSAYQRVSNVVSYSPGTTDLFELTLGANYELGRSGYYGDDVQWVIEEDGQVVLERNAADELSYTYFANSTGSSYRIWLKQFIDGEYKVVSNIVNYGVGQQQFTLSVDELYGLARDGQPGDPVQWVVEKNGVIVLERDAADELEFTYYDNTPGASFRVWLQMYQDGAYQVVSNVVEYEVPATYPYTVTLGDNYELTRSGSLGDKVTWVIKKNGSVVLKRYASNELSYTYYSNTPGSTIQVYLQQYIDGYYQPVSNTVEYMVQ
jgi:hypothetical protein